MPEYTSRMAEDAGEREATGRAPLASYEDLAGRLTLALTKHSLTEEAVYAGCREAIAQQIAGVLLRPSDLDLAKNWLEGSAVELAALTGYPGGSSTTAARIYEGRDVVRRGASELLLTMNLGKLVSRKFLYLESELLQIVEQCHQAQARMQAVFEMDSVQQDHVLIGVRLMKRTGVDAMGLAFVSPVLENGPSLDRMVAVVRYVAHHGREKFRIHVQAPGLALDGLMALYEAGADGFAIGNAGAVAGAWRTELQRREEERKRLEQQAPSSAPTAQAEPLPSE